MLDHQNHVAIICYIALSVISIVINGIIVLLILQRVTKIQTPYLLLIFYFHISIVGDVITALPYAFTSSQSWCEFNQSMKYYFSLMNILIILLLVQGNRITLTLASDMAVVFERRVFAYFVIFLLPCISFFPYSTDYFHHGNDNNPFCAVTDTADSYWPIIVQYFWVWLVNFLNFTTNAYISYILFRGNHSPQLRRRFFLGIGGYSFIAIVAWITRSAAQFSLRVPEDDDSTSNNEAVRYELFRFYPLVIASLCYSGLFFINRKTILMLERAKSTTTNDTLSISVKELLDIVERGEGKSFYHSFKSFFRGSSSGRFPSEVDSVTPTRDSEEGRYTRPSNGSTRNSSSNNNNRNSSNNRISNHVMEEPLASNNRRTISANAEGIIMQDFVMYDNPLNNTNHSHKGKAKSKTKLPTDSNK